MILYYLFASLGLCYILKYGTILNKPRNYFISKFNFCKELFGCSLCLGFWCGVFMIPFIWFSDIYLNVSIVYPLASAAFCWTMDLLLDLAVAMTNFFKEEHKEV